MTCRELLEIEHPDRLNTYTECGCCGCPDHYGYADIPNQGIDQYGQKVCILSCTECWDRDVDPKATGMKLSRNIPNREEERVEPHILDSGDRTEFESGAVRDMRVGKGRCDLLPLDVVADYSSGGISELDNVLMNIYSFQEHNDLRLLYTALSCFVYEKRKWCDYTMLLEVAKHFEEGAKKYGDDNWKKGIPTNVYIDSAVRHYLKFLRGDKDEPHDRAFCWNILCCIWTCIHKPELNVYRKLDKGE